MVILKSPPGTIYNSSPSRPSPREVVQIPDAVRARCGRGVDTPPKPEIFMCPRLSCICMHLEMWAEVKVHSYQAHAHVFVGSCTCYTQATPLSKLQWA